MSEGEEGGRGEGGRESPMILLLTVLLGFSFFVHHGSWTHISRTGPPLLVLAMLNDPLKSICINMTPVGEEENLNTVTLRM